MDHSPNMCNVTDGLRQSAYLFHHDASPVRKILQGGPHYPVLGACVVNRTECLLTITKLLADFNDSSFALAAIKCLNW